MREAKPNDGFDRAQRITPPVVVDGRIDRTGRYRLLRLQRGRRTTSWFCRYRRGDSDPRWIRCVHDRVVDCGRQSARSEAGERHADHDQDTAQGRSQGRSDDHGGRLANNTITTRGVFVAPEKDEAEIVLNVPKDAKVGLRQDGIISGLMRANNQSIVRYARAIPVIVVK